MWYIFDLAFWASVEILTMPMNRFSSVTSYRTSWPAPAPSGSSPVFAPSTWSSPWSSSLKPKERRWSRSRPCSEGRQVHEETLLLVFFLFKLTQINRNRCQDSSSSQFVFLIFLFLTLNLNSWNEIEASLLQLPPSLRCLTGLLYVTHRSQFLYIL